jgi:hypothetical protein
LDVPRQEVLNRQRDAVSETIARKYPWLDAEPSKIGNVKEEGFNLKYALKTKVVP